MQWDRGRPGSWNWAGAAGRNGGELPVGLWQALLVVTVTAVSKCLRDRNPLQGSLPSPLHLLTQNLSTANLACSKEGGGEGERGVGGVELYRKGSLS